jgi:hypothetical protein
MFVRLILLITIILIAAPSRATVIVPATLSELASEALAIVVGRVVDLDTLWTDGRRGIETLVTIEAVAYLKGNLGERVVIRVPGGEVGAFRSIVVGAPSFHRGEEVVLFLTAHGPSLPTVIGLSQGVFRVVTDISSGRKLVTPPALFVRSDEPQRIERGSRARQPVPMETFANDVRALAAGKR